MSDEIYNQILEWDRAKKAMENIEKDVDYLGPLQAKGAIPSYQMIINAQFARALRLIMESLETKT